MTKVILSSRLRNGEFILFHKNVVNLCNNSDPQNLHIQVQVNNLGNAITPLDVAFARDRSSLYTGELARLDERRDKSLVGIRTLAEAYAHHFDSNMQHAGQVMLAAIDKYGTRLIHLNYVLKTQVIMAMVGEFQAVTPAHAAATLLSIDAWVTELKNVNTAFNEMYLTRTNEYALQPDSNIHELRAGVSQKYQELCDVIFSHSTLTPSPDYDLLLENLDILVDQYNTTSAGRGNEEDDDGPPATPPTPPQQ